jgi:flagellin-like protein
MRGFERRGLAPVVASVLLIMLVLVAASLIFLWARGFIGEQVEKFGTPIGELCEAVDFEVQLIGEDTLEVVNRGDIDIFKLNVKKIKDGDSETGKFEYSIDARKSESKPITVRMSNSDRPDKIELFPVLVGNVKGASTNKAVPCESVSRTISLQ